MSNAAPPVRLAVVLDHDECRSGGFHQSINAARLVAGLPADLCTPSYFVTGAPQVARLREFGLDATHLELPAISRMLLKLRSTIRQPELLRLARRVAGDNPLDRAFGRQGVDLVYFTSPSSLAQRIERFSFIVTVWDLCYRDCPEFPEVSFHREFERRDALYASVLPKAVAVLVDSMSGHDNVVRRYGVDPGRAFILPFSPSPAVQLDAPHSKACDDMREQFGLSCAYVFYPAHYWPHKNHVYLLQALARLEQQHGIKLGAIFCGSDVGGNLRHVEDVARNLAIKDRVRFAGFIDDVTLKCLYRQAVALVMPTYFGPTNLPPIEAFSLGVPVVYSNLPGLRDQVGDAALLVDLDDPTSLSNALSRLARDNVLRDELIKRGYARLQSVNDTDRLVVLSDILRKFQVRRQCWS